MLVAKDMLTEGLTCSFTRKMDMLEGSEETEVQVMVLESWSFHWVPLVGLVTWMAGWVG
jgi:hypothetical protein